MDPERLVLVYLSPKIVSRFFPYRAPGPNRLDRVEVAFLSSLGLVDGDVQEHIIDERDHAAFVVLHNLNNRMIFRVRYPFVEIMHENSRLKVFPVYSDGVIKRKILDEADVLAVVDRNGDVVYYEVEVANL